MSWIRWGSPCRFAQASWTRWCHGKDEPCIGSSVYVYENTENRIVCCDCLLLGPGKDPEADFEAATETEMVAHLRAHHEDGHHVPLVLFDEETRARETAFWEAMTEEQRLAWMLAAWNPYQSFHTELFPSFKFLE